MKTPGPGLAILSAALFGISPTLTKMIIGEVPPILVAGLLYLGSGIGLFLIVLIQGGKIREEFAALPPRHGLKLVGATLSGGILAPLCLTYGILLASAFEVSLLLNLESVTTTVIAAVFFGEHIGRRVWAGKALLIVGGLLLTVRPEGDFALSLPSLLVIAACVFWGIDNNLTRDVDQLSPSVLAGTKGLVAGVFNTAIAIAFGQKATQTSVVLATLGIGAFSYGLSLVLFVKALRFLGSSRTSTYFAAGPFLGMLFALVLLGERPTGFHWVASAIMLAGVWALSREAHQHSHSHESITHRHKHVHNEHHQHLHDGHDGNEPHDHRHTHQAITHSHVHWPDIHHRHGHGRRDSR